MDTTNTDKTSFHGLLTTGLTEPTRTATVEGLWTPGKALPFVDRGLLIYVDPLPLSHNMEAGTVRDLNDGSEKSFSVWFEGATEMHVTQAAAAKTGNIVAVGWAEKSKGVFNGYVALIDPSGKLVNSIQTGSFLPGQVCATDDNAVWTVGADAEANIAGKSNSYGILRQYSFEKGELTALLRKSALGGFNPSGGTTGPIGEIMLRCAGPRVIVFCPRNHMWVGVDAVTKHLYRMKVEAAPSSEIVDGFAVTKDGGEYVSLGGMPTLFQLKRDSISRSIRWVPVAGTPKEFVALMGVDADGDSLVYLATPKDHSSNVWVSPRINTQLSNGLSPNEEN